MTPAYVREVIAMITVCVAYTLHILHTYAPIIYAMRSLFISILWPQLYTKARYTQRINEPANEF